MEELKIPEGIEGDPNAMEMIRVWIANKDIHVSMLLGMWETAANFDIDEREAWGELLADLIRHIANGLKQSHDYNAHASERRIAMPCSPTWDTGPIPFRERSRIPDPVL